jgi:biotin transport system ATP-binding protein
LFEGLSLRLDERRIGLLGDNGAGKSSLLRLINGLLPPDEGEVRVGGLSTRAARSEILRRVGFVFQNPEHQIVFPTVVEEIAFGIRERGVDPARADARARDILAAEGCAAWSDSAVHELSEGQKQRLCILAVAATEPDVLLLDEPFASLDLPTRLHLTDVLLALPQRLIVASHDLDLLACLDRIVWLDAGSVAADGRPGDVIAAYRDACHGRRRVEAAQ